MALTSEHGHPRAQTGSGTPVVVDTSVDLTARQAVLGQFWLWIGPVAAFIALVFLVPAR